MLVHLTIVSLAHVHQFFVKSCVFLFKLSQICASSTYFMVNVGNQPWDDDNISLGVCIFVLKRNEGNSLIIPFIMSFI
jgi:hypothetical protein